MKPRTASPSARPWFWRIMGVSVILALGFGALLMFQPWATNASDFAADRDKKSGAVDFDAKRAMGYLEDICKIGPRISGTKGMKKQQELIEKHFKKHGGKVTYQKFTARQRSVRKPVEMANMVVSYHPDRKNRVILCSHYDTRPIADQEPMRKRWQEPFVSANDGGSGVALLMELAHHMKDIKTNVGVDFVFFDGEEYIYDPEDDEYFFGSKHFAKEYRKIKHKTKYLGAILLDMVAGQNAVFPQERNSIVRAGRLVKEVWGIAAELKCNTFANRLSKVEVLDDHIPLNQAGIPAIDIIDFDYKHWHRLTDVPKNCSGEPMRQVAQVCSVWLQRVK